MLNFNTKHIARLEVQADFLQGRIIYLENLLIRAGEDNERQSGITLDHIKAEVAKIKHDRNRAAKLFEQLTSNHKERKFY